MESQDSFYAVILAGGGGTRLWPKSTQDHPKHLLKLFGDKTLLKITYERIEPIIPKEKILVITNHKYVSEVKKQLPELSPNNIIIEPEAKNTALAMGVAAAYVHHRHPDSQIVYLAADQMIKNVKAFQETILTALEVAKQGDYIVSIGIKPTFAHTGLGYIRTGQQIGHLGIKRKDRYVFKSRGFKEKPDLPTAQAFLASGEYLWNANLYCWSTQTIFNALKQHNSTLNKLIQQVSEAIGTPEEAEVLKKVYSEADNVQIDVAVSEKATNLLVVPGDFGWSDIGDWKVVYDTINKDTQANVIINNEGADLINIGSSNCLIETNGRLVVAIGLDDLVIVDTKQALLVCKKDRTQDVKKAVEELKSRKKDQFL